MARFVSIVAISVVLVLFVAFPLGLLAGSLVRHPDAFLALADPLNLRAAWNTVLLALGVLAVALALGAPLGFLLGRSDLPAKGLLRSLCTAPYIVPPYVSAIAWMALLNPTNGVANRALATLEIPPFDIYSLTGMIFVMGLESTPFVMLATADTLGRMDASLEEQARIAGASRGRTMWTVTLPMALPGLLVASSFVLASAAAAFGVPYLLASGTAEPDFVLTTRITQALDLDPARGRPLAVALSIVLLAVGVGLPLLLSRMKGRRRFVTIAGKATRIAPFSLGRWRGAALGAVLLYVAVAVVLPLATIATTSLLANFGAALSLESLTLEHYRDTLGSSVARGALLRSLGLATAAATIAVVVGTLVAWFHTRSDLPVRRPLAAMARLPFAIPGTVLALGLLLAYSQEIRVILLDRVTFALALSDTLWILGLAYVVKFLPFPVGQAEAGLESVDASLEEAARMSGAGFIPTLRRVTLPLLAPNLIAAWFLVFMPAFTEVTMSILLAGPDTRVVGTLLFDLQTYGNPPAAAVLAAMVTAIVFGGNLLVKLLSRGAVGI